MLNIKNRFPVLFIRIDQLKCDGTFSNKLIINP